MMNHIFKILIFLLIILAISNYSIHAAWLEETEESEPVVEEVVEEKDEEKQPEIIPPEVEEKQSEPVEAVEEVEESDDYYLQVTLIRAEKVSPDSIMIGWQGVDEQGISYQIYRSTNIPDSEEVIKNSIMVYSGLQTIYTDKGIEGGTYYYAVTVKDANGNEDRNLIPDQSYYTLPLIIDKKEKPKNVTGLTAVLNEETVILNWNSELENIIFKIYRNTERIINKNILNSSIILGTVRSPDKSYEDILFSKGKYYYAVTTENEVGENYTIVSGDNSLIEPIDAGEKEKLPEPEKPEPEPEKPESVVITPAIKTQFIVKVPSVKREFEQEIKLDNDEMIREINNIIRNEYFNEEYHSTIAALESIISFTTSKDVINKANLYIGKSYYGLAKYKKAISIFAKLENIYPDESDFWIKRCLEKIK